MYYASTFLGVYRLMPLILSFPALIVQADLTNFKTFTYRNKVNL